MKLHPVLHGKYLLRTVFSVPSTLANGWLNLCSSYQLSHHYSRDQCEINNLLWKHSFWQFKRSHYELCPGQSVPLRPHACSWLTHVFSAGFPQFQGLLDDKEGHMQLFSCPHVVFEALSIYAHFLTFRFCHGFGQWQKVHTAERCWIKSWPWPADRPGLSLRRRFCAATTLTTPISAYTADSQR